MGTKVFAYCSTSTNVRHRLYLQLEFLLMRKESQLLAPITVKAPLFPTVSGSVGTGVSRPDDPFSFYGGCAQR